jgi:hypothetical protein
MSAPRPASTRALSLGTLLILAGLVAWALYVKQSNSERHSYARGGAPPSYVQLSAGKTYGIAIRGGVLRELQLGVRPSGLHCTAARPGEAPGALPITSEPAPNPGDDPKTTNQIATFLSGISGPAHVQCQGLTDVYVDNADDAAFDWSGLWLVLASLALAVGLPLALSGLRRPVRRVDPAAEGGFEFQGEREAHVVGAGPGDHLHAEWQPPVTEAERDLGRG